MLFILLLALGILFTNVSSDTPVRLGPVFTVEPPALVRYASSAGTRVQCAARGDPPPRLSWLADDGSTLSDAPGVRRVYSNGTLELFPSGAYRDEQAASTVRCRAVNPHGAIVSRDVTLQPG
nr:Down syndrome cell adhesion molecule-like protein Dscam2 [Vanessa tameamea]